MSGDLIAKLKAYRLLTHASYDGHKLAGKAIKALAAKDAEIERLTIRATAAEAHAKKLAEALDDLVGEHEGVFDVTDDDFAWPVNGTEAVVKAIRTARTTLADYRADTGGGE